MDQRPDVLWIRFRLVIVRVVRPSLVAVQGYGFRFVGRKWFLSDPVQLTNLGPGSYRGDLLLLDQLLGDREVGPEVAAGPWITHEQKAAVIGGALQKFVEGHFSWKVWKESDWVRTLISV